jgi:hypothetical protein
MKIFLRKEIQYFLSLLFTIIFILICNIPPTSAKMQTGEGLKNESDTLFHFPVIIKEGRKISDFVPKGWKIIDTAFAYIDGDTLKDFAMVIETADTLYYPEGSHYDEDSLKVDYYNYAKPRILIIAFKQKKGRLFELSCQSNTAVIPSNGGRFSDPYAGISAGKGRVSIDFVSWGYDNWNLSHTYRLKNKLWTLSEADKNSGNARFSERAIYNLESGILEYWYEEQNFFEDTDSLISSRKEEYFKIIKSDSIIPMKNFKPWSLEIDERHYF